MQNILSSNELFDDKVAQDVELVEVTKRYGDTVAVDAVSHRFGSSSYTCLLGPSGCGKSSTLRMIAGHEAVTEGSILLAGRDISSLPPAKRGTAMMFQNYALFPHLSAQDNVAFSLKMSGVDKTERKLTWYSCRHFYGTKRIEEGVDVFLLADQMGTGIMMIQQHYSHRKIKSQTSKLNIFRKRSKPKKM